MVQLVEALSDKVTPLPTSIELRDQRFHQAFDRQLNMRLSRGFHTELGLSVGEYLESFSHLLGPAWNKPSSVGYPAFVEPRIPVRDQLDMLGVNIDPTVYSVPENSEATVPYLTRVRNMQMSDVPPENVFSAIAQEGEESNQSLHLASLLEALAVFNISSPEYVAGPRNARVLGLDTFSGRPRLFKPEHGVVDKGIKHALVSIAERTYHG